jgi:MoaA/NifB/PqqE/SkfB family radical SAM enzyme
MILHRDKPQTTFDTDTGILIRDGDEKPAAPELIDLKVTDKCQSTLCGDLCYMCSTPEGKHADVHRIIDQLYSLPTMPFQIACGGGEPTEWLDLLTFIEWCTSKNIVCNMAIGPANKTYVAESAIGLGMKAIGISYINQRLFETTATALRGKGAKLFAHCILRADYIQHWIEERDRILEQVDLRPTRDEFKRLYEVYEGREIGFDSCCYPLLKGNVPDEILDNCDGGKYSMFYDGVSQKVGRCSFLNTPTKLGVISLKEAWDKMPGVDSCIYQFAERS